MRRQWKLHKLVWNLSGGRLGRRVTGQPVLELVTTGRRSGAPRTILITHVVDEGRPVIIGANAGATHDPAWVNNLRADPACRIRREGRWRDARAEFLAGTDHERTWLIAVAATPATPTTWPSLSGPSRSWPSTSADQPSRVG